MGEGILTEADLVKHFFIMWSELGRQPGPRDIQRFILPSLRSYEWAFGSWEGFLGSLGLAPTGLEEEPLPERGFMAAPPVPLAASRHGGLPAPLSLTYRGGLPAPLTPPRWENAPSDAQRGARRSRGRPLPIPSGVGWGVDEPGYGVAAFSRLRKRAGTALRSRRAVPALCASLLVCLCLTLPLAGPSSCGTAYLPGDDEAVAVAEPLQAPYVTAVSVGGSGGKPLAGLRESLFSGVNLPTAVPTEAPVAEVEPGGAGESVAVAGAEPVGVATPAEVAEPAGVATPAPPNEAEVASAVPDEVPKAATPGEALIPAERVTAEVEATEKNKLATNKQDFILAVTEGSVFSASLPEPSGEAGARRQVVTVAAELLGRAYVLEGTNPPYSFTCSIFVEYCMKQVGIYVPAPSKTQWAVLDAEKCGLDEAIKSLVPGDVVFFVGSPVLSNGQPNPAPGHVGIYIGDGKFIHAANHARGVVMDSLLQRSDFWGWGSIAPLLVEKMAEPTEPWAGDMD